MGCTSQTCGVANVNDLREMTKKAYWMILTGVRRKQMYVGSESTYYYRVSSRHPVGLRA